MKTDRQCERCEGRGYWPPYDDPGNEHQYEPCRVCLGTGRRLTAQLRELVEQRYAETLRQRRTDDKAH